MAHTDLLKAAGDIIEREAEFPEMPRMAQARYRSSVTRLLKDDAMNEYPEIKAYIEEIATRIGKPKGKAKMSAESLEREFYAEYSDMEPKRKGAFKARVSRLQGEAEKANDKATLKRLERLTAEIVKVEKALDKAEAKAEADRVRALIAKAKGEAE